MAETIQTKQCSHCKKIKPFSEFYKKQVSKDGYQNQCNTCNAIFGRKFQQTEKGRKVSCRANKRYYASGKGKKSLEQFRQNNPDKINAYVAVNNAIKLGKIPRASIFQCTCGKQAQEYHHHKGYKPIFWFDVIPICIKCHRNLKPSFHLTA